MKLKPCDIVRGKIMADRDVLISSYQL